MSPRQEPGEIRLDIATSTKSETPQSSVLTKFHAGYFRISLSLCFQVLVWKTLSDKEAEHSTVSFIIHVSPSITFILLWVLTLFILLLLTVLYLFKLIVHFHLVELEFLHRVGVNYLFAPWISWLLLLESSPFFTPKDKCFTLLYWCFSLPILALDVKIYGQWLTKGKRFLSTVANPTSQISVVGNLVVAKVAALMGSKEIALFMFSLGIIHYLVLFVTLYQRFSGSDRLSIRLRPVLFLFVATPSMGSLAWVSIHGRFDIAAKMFFFLSLFLFVSLVSRPILFKKSMKKFNVAWWGYSFPLLILSLASVEYSSEVKGKIPQGLMFGLIILSFIVSSILAIFTAIKANVLLSHHQVHCVFSPPMELPKTAEISGESS